MSNAMLVRGIAGATLGVALAIAPAADAKKHKNSVHVHPPKSAHVGKQYTYSVSGFAKGKADRLAGFIDSQKCEKNALAEAGHSTSSEYDFGPVKGKYDKKVYVTSSLAGKRHICAYLYNHTTFKTYAHGSATYTVKP